MKNNHPIRVLLSLAALLGVSVSASAQVDRATIAGTVKDVTSGVLPGADVVVRSGATGAIRTVVSEASGAYRVAGLSPGAYVVEISFPGFNTARVQDVQLRVAETRTIDVTLEVAAAETVVEVREVAPIADRSSAQQGTVVSSEELNKVPVNGRDWSSYMLLAPGAVDSGGGSQRSIRFMGRSKDDNNYMFDGIDATGVKEGPHLTALRTVISNDAIAEFRVTAGVFTAEYGNSIGGVVSLLSKSGTNQYRGGLYEYHRNSALDARRFIDVTKPDFEMNQFGGNLGGPIVSGRTFFFVNYEGLRQSLDRTFIGFVPSQAFRQRALATSPALKPIIEAFPAGTSTTSNADIDQYTALWNTRQDENSVMGRLDQRFGDSTSAYVRYNVADGVIATPQSIFGNVTDANLTSQNLAVQLQNVQRSFVNEVKVGFNRSANSRDAAGALRETVTIPGFTIVPGSSTGADPGTSYSFGDNLTLLLGRHTVKAGAEVRRNQVDISQGDSFSAVYATRDAFVANRADNVSFVGAFSPRKVRTDTYAAYVLDELKVTPNLTLNAGLRYEYYTPLHEADGRQRIYDRFDCGGVCPAGSETYFPDRNNFGPRVSVAWSPERFGGRTVFRVGGGVYHQQGQLDDSSPIESDNTRTTLTAREIPALAYPVDPFLGLGSATFDTPRALLRRRHDFESYQAGAFVAQELPGGFATQVGYLTNIGRHILERTFDNAIDPETGLRPLPAYGLVDIKFDGGQTKFHGLQASVQRRYQRGLVLNAQYQLGHAKDQGAAGSNEANYPQDLTCRECEWGDSNFDVRHQFTLNWVYELPFDGDSWAAQGWEVSGLFTTRTGMPINVTVTRPSTDVADGYTAAFGTSTQRPNLVSGVNPIPDNQTRENWLNLAAFSTPAAGARGTLPRNAFRGPGMTQLDAALSKRVMVSPNASMTFRLEVFNLLNTEQLGRPNTNISSPADFGRVTTVLNAGATGSGTARQTQLMVRYAF